MPVRKPSAKAEKQAKATYAAALAQMTNGRLQRERMALKVLAVDDWHMELWRQEDSRRSPGYS